MTPGDDRGAAALDDSAARPFLVVFSDDWGRHPSSCQHLVRQLLPRYSVAWVNTIGTRPPRLDWLTVKRAAGKLSGWTTSKRVEASESSTGAEPTVSSPVMWPRFARPWERRLNAFLLERALRQALPANRRAIAITTIPLVADLVGRSPVDRWVYYCVDDLSEWPGLDRRTLLEMERLLVDRVDEIVVVSETLKDRIEAMGRSCTLLTHGVDLKPWRTLAAPSQPALSNPILNKHERPMVVFWGVIDRRLDSEWLRTLAQQLESGTVLLVGPTNNPDPALEAIEGVTLAPAMPYEKLPELAGAAAVLIMPYADLPATRAMQPLKLKEYLATERAVVVSALPAVESWSDACDVASSASEFADLVSQRLRSGLLPSQARARRRLDEETWLLKAETFEALLLKAL